MKQLESKRLKGGAFKPKVSKNKVLRKLSIGSVTGSPNYNPDFVLKALKGKEQIKDGQFIEIRVEDLWK